MTRRQMLLVLTQAGTTGGGVLVLIFTRTDCPISNRYAPELRRLFAEYSTGGVEFKLVYPESGITQEMVDRHRAEFAYPMPGIADPEHRYVRQAQASITPEAVVFAKGRLVYRGRIDDRFASLSQSRPEPSSRDLEDVLRALASGRTPPARFTKAVGCVIEKAP
jgi:hypothetical protein